MSIAKHVGTQEKSNGVVGRRRQAMAAMPTLPSAAAMASTNVDVRTALRAWQNELSGEYVLV